MSTVKMENRKTTKLKKRLNEALASGDLSTVNKIMLELAQLEHEVNTHTENISLAEATGGNNELRNKLCSKLVETNVYADLLYACAMEFQSMLPSVVVSMDYLQQCKRLVKQAHDVVASIDKVGNVRLSEHYAEMTEKVEEKITYFVKNTISNIVNKEIRFI